MKKAREFVFGWMGWCFVELASLISRVVPENCDKCFTYLGGGFFYRLGNKCYHIAYDFN